MTTKKACSSCKFWSRYSSTFNGECRRHPPKPKPPKQVDEFGANFNPTPGPTDAWSFPVTCSTDWCGEFEQKAKR